MELPSKSFFEFLLSKGVTHIHHANTVITAASFLRAGALLARGVMDHNGHLQSAQRSDDADKKWGVYFDVFLDSVDIHKRAKKRNIYGPVLFSFSVEKLAKLEMPPLWVTKSNPEGWIEKQDHKDRWFTSLDDLNQNFAVGRFNQMIVIRHMGGVFSFGDTLDQIVIDDPRRKASDVDIYSLARGALFLATKEGRMKNKVDVIRRTCHATCKCGTEYKNNDNLRLFIPSAKRDD